MNSFEEMAGELALTAREIKIKRKNLLAEIEEEREE